MASDSRTAAGDRRPRPWWRGGFDRLERAVAEPLETLVHQPGYALATAAWTAADRRCWAGLEQGSAWLWHLVNLPAASDLARVRREIAALDHELRAVAARFDALQPDGRGGAPREDRGGRS